jgi:citrate lyase subunit beta / citryl-CoA lyase
MAGQHATNLASMPNRSMLFIPGSNAAMLSTAYVFKPDAVMFDLEDGVALRAKDTARLMVFHTLRSGLYSGMQTVVRINPLDTPFGQLDLECAVRGGADVIRLPKTETPEDILELEDRVAKIEIECDREEGSTKLMAAIESASGVVNAVAIARSSPRLVSMALAGFDYVVDMQTTRGDGSELFYARCAVLHAARVAGLACYDVVYGDVNDEEGFLREVDTIRRLGFNGKSLVNPRQIEMLHNAYAPTQAEYDNARLILDAAKRAEAAGLGVVSLNGKMVDAPVIAAAQRTAQFAEVSGVRVQ